MEVPPEVVPLLKFIGTRIVYTVLALWLLATVTFFLMQAMPGDPFLKPKALPESVERNIRAKWGLDKPVFVQYVVYITNAATGDFGYSFYYKGSRTVAEVIAGGFPASFDLGIRSLLVALVLGLLLGIVAALNAGKLGDSFAMLLAILGVSIPAFVLAYLMQYFLAYKLTLALKPVLGFRLFPITGWRSNDWYKAFSAKILPVVGLSFGSMATISRLMRSSMLDVINSDYIKTAKAKGLSRNDVILRHMIRNSIMPIVTVLGPMAAAILTGTFVIESIFGVPGMGKLYITSVQNQDYTVIMGTTLFYGAFLVFMNLLVDIAYGLIDPRIRLSH
jgi:oligopeptide transport system permease protein